MQEFLSTADVARRLGLTAATVRLMARRGTLRVAGRTEGGIQLFVRADVDDLAERRANNRSEAANAQ